MRFPFFILIQIDMKHFFVLLSSLFFIELTATAQIANKNNRNLLWHDNFDSLNTSMWTVADYSDHYGEPQLYKKEQVFCENGNLCIVIQDSLIDCPEGIQANNPGSCGTCKAGSHNYVSGWIESKQKYATQYGYIEARIKMPYRFGLWPAFWTFEQVSNNVNAAEIDIFEMLGYKPENVITTNIHKIYPDGNVYYKEKSLRNFSYTDWHTYSILWNEDVIIWYIDGKKIRKTKRHGVVDPVRFIFNLAVTGKNHLPTDKHFCDTMFVDYIQVFEK